MAEERRYPWAIGVMLTAALLLAACDMDVRGNWRGSRSDVDIRTPVGSFTARSDDTSVVDTGLPVYPGARPLRERNEGDRANVAIDTPFFNLAVAAAKFESDDPLASVLEFYRSEMRAFGDVIECRGDIDFRGREDRRRPVCDENKSDGQTTLVVGSERDHRTVSAKRRGAGTEFALVHIQNDHPR